MIDNKEGTAIAVRVPGDIGMAALLGDVSAFHRACDVPVTKVLTWPTQDRIDLRNRMLNEELTEYNDAIAGRNMTEFADAIADCIYILVGTALEFGIPLDRVWAEVQRSNMAKVDPVTGKVRKRDDGKILKPEGWQAPDIAGALGIK